MGWSHSALHLLSPTDRQVVPRLNQLTTGISQRRKEQNRKAQRNHRLRSEAKLDQLRARVKTQADEIVMLRDFNQSLMKHIETLECKDKDGGTASADGQRHETTTDSSLPDTSESP